MRSPRNTLLALGGAAFFSATLAWMPIPAGACGDKAENCPCGAACPSKQAGACAGEAGCEEKAAAACACKGAAAAPAATGQPADAAAGGCKHAESASKGDKPAAHQHAVLDPATGQFVEPNHGEDHAGSTAPAASASANAAAAAAPVVQPGGGLMATVPAERANKAVATLDESGKPHTGCAE